MSINQISIWNRALGFLGARGVAAEQENTPEAPAVSAVLGYSPAAGFARLSLEFRPAPGPGSRRRPCPKATRPNSALPMPCPTCASRCTPYGTRALRPRPFRLGRNAAGDAPLLLTDSDRALALYTEDVQNPRLFDDLFAHILARKLGGPGGRTPAQRCGPADRRTGEALCRRPAASPGRRRLRTQGAPCGRPLASGPLTFFKEPLP